MLHLYPFGCIFPAYFLHLFCFCALSRILGGFPKKTKIPFRCRLKQTKGGFANSYVCSVCILSQPTPFVKGNVGKISRKFGIFSRCPIVTKNCIIANKKSRPTRATLIHYFSVSSFAITISAATKKPTIADKGTIQSKCHTDIIFLPLLLRVLSFLQRQHQQQNKEL